MAACSENCSGGSMQDKTDNYEAMEDDEPAEDDNELPVVLQCKNCNSVVGDSLAWVCANDDLKTVTLRSITNTVATGKKLMTSTTEGIDLGSTYVHLLCKQCDEVIGRIYKTTSRQLDSLRDLFTISVHQIVSYQVGSKEQTADVDLHLEDMLDLPTAKSLKDSIFKTQVMVCALNNRILNIENSLELKEDHEGPNQDQDTTKSNNQGQDRPPGDKYSTEQDASGQTVTRKQPIGRQDKTTPEQNDSGVAERDGSGSMQNGRQYGTKRSKELTAVTGARGNNKRSRFK